MEKVHLGKHLIPDIKFLATSVISTYVLCANHSHSPASSDFTDLCLRVSRVPRQSSDTASCIIVIKNIESFTSNDVKYISDSCLQLDGECL